MKYNNSELNNNKNIVYSETENVSRMNDKDKAMLQRRFLDNGNNRGFCGRKCHAEALAHWEKYVILALNIYFETESRVESTIEDYTGLCSGETE